MKLFVLSLFFILFFALTVTAQNPTPKPTPPNPDDEVVKISTTLIQVDVTVTDKNGKVVTDLKPEDFEIYENGKLQKMTNFLFINPPAQTKTVIRPPTKKGQEDKTAMPIPPVQLKPEQVRRTIALIVDDLGLSFESIVRVRNSLKKFVDQQMQPNDLVGIIASGNGAGTLQQFTSDKRQLYAAIEKLQWNARGRAGITPFAPLGQITLDKSASESSGSSDEQSADDVNQQQSDLEQQMYNNNYIQDIFSIGTLGAINYVVKGMNQLPGRKSVMLFSDGFPVCTMDSETGETDLERCKKMEEALKRLTDLCNRNSVSIYSFDARGLMSTASNAGDAGTPTEMMSGMQNRSQQMSDNQQGLEVLAKDTGGRTFFNRNDLTDTISYALEDQNGYYLLAYEPDADSFDAKKLKFNKLEVKLKREGYEVRFRNGFYGYTDDKPLETTQNPTDKTVDALMSPFAINDIELRLNTLFGNNQTGSFVNSFLHIDPKNLTFVDQPDGSKKLSFEVLASSFGENGATIDQVGRKYNLNLPSETYKQVLEEGFVYNFIFPVKQPGSFQMRVAVRDVVSSKLGSANQFVEIPDLKKGRLALSGIVLENFSEEPSTSAPQPITVNDITIGKGDPKVDSSLRKFDQGTFLRYITEIYNAKTGPDKKPKLQTQIRVFKDGKAILNQPMKPLETDDKTNPQSVLFGGKLALGKELSPGEYILQIIVKDTLAKEKNNLVTQWVQFEIVK
jgi:VWFA-related protein